MKNPRLILLETAHSVPKKARIFQYDQANEAQAEFGALCWEYQPHLTDNQIEEYVDKGVYTYSELGVTFGVYLIWESD